MEDATSCFYHLVQHVPPWVARIDAVTQQLGPRQAHLAEEEASRKRTDSSARSASSHERDLPSPKRQRMGNAQRARSSSSSSGRTRASSTRMIIVYYDADFQQAMIELVKDIASARNMLRKCRMAYKAKTALTPGLFSSTLGIDLSSLAAGDDDNTAEDVVAKLRFQRSLRARGPDTSGADKDIYEKTDAFLERAQGQCEFAAHQFLRDGASRIELNDAKVKLGQALQQAQDEITKFEKEKAESSQADESTTAGSETSTKLSTPGSSNAVSSSPYKLPIALPSPTIGAIAVDTPNFNGVIEVDDKLHGAGPIEVDDNPSSELSTAALLSSFTSKRRQYQPQRYQPQIPEAKIVQTTLESDGPIEVDDTPSTELSTAALLSSITSKRRQYQPQRYQQPVSEAKIERIAQEVKTAKLADPGAGPSFQPMQSTQLESESAIPLSVPVASTVTPVKPVTNGTTPFDQSSPSMHLSSTAPVKTPLSVSMPVQPASSSVSVRIARPSGAASTHSSRDDLWESKAQTVTSIS